jgi:hypothetical protein
MSTSGLRKALPSVKPGILAVAGVLGLGIGGREVLRNLDMVDS